MLCCAKPWSASQLRLQRGPHSTCSLDLRLWSISSLQLPTKGQKSHVKPQLKYNAFEASVFCFKGWLVCGLRQLKLRIQCLCSRKWGMILAIHPILFSLECAGTLTRKMRIFSWLLDFKRNTQPSGNVFFKSTD